MILNLGVFYPEWQDSSWCFLRVQELPKGPYFESICRCQVSPNPLNMTMYNLADPEAGLNVIHVELKL